MASLSQLMGQLVSLTDAEKRFVISNLSNLLIRGEVGNYEPKEITEKRLAYDKKCPHCGDFSFVIKYGVKKGRQRFYCKVCNKTFGETYNTVLFSTKKDIGKLLEFAWCLVRGFSIKKCHEEVNISTRTAFYWRHKILLAIAKTINLDQVDGLVEADETYFLESFKGQRKVYWKIVGRNPF
jgi:transposase-like protein